MRLLAAYVITKALGAKITLDSNDARHVFAGGGTGRVAARTRAAPPEPGCVERRVGDAHLEVGNTDDVFVRRCGAPPVSSSSPSRPVTCWRATSSSDRSPPCSAT